ncbi:TonB family protein [Cesiribacter sp. SM1]|uniref:M56 family metallopeptidase n=1 Tax=Cesiribacter sp. SM1 TaxID=2861196 RepID=UPI001CD58667|nr:M56 family metallopeptidase [Cesiribacter sp. SM1]
MNSLFNYLITSSWLLLLLALGYFLLLQNQKLLRFTRFYLVGSLLLCLLHPFVAIISTILPANAEIAGTTLSITQVEQYLPELVLSPQQTNNASSALSLLFALYLTGSSIALLLFLVRLVKLRSMLNKLSFQSTPEQFLLSHSEGAHPTFSFFHYLVINKTHIATAEEYSLVLQHEQAHARELHSADVLLAELVQVVLWFHPGIYLLNNALRQTHEHLADAAVIKTSGTETTYIALMAKEGLAAAGLPLSSTFFQSFTINRIRMIKKHTLPSSKWRITVTSLFATALIAFIACEEQVEQVSSSPTNATEVYEMLPPPPPAEMPENPSKADIAAVIPDATGIYNIVEEEAMPIEGMAAFYQQLFSHINYPEEALAEKVEGTVYIRFVVDENGNVASAEPVKERMIGYGLEDEAIRVIEATKWTPAKQRGNTVKQRKILPVKFILKDATKEKSIKKHTSVLFQGMMKAPAADAC